MNANKWLGFPHPISVIDKFHHPVEPMNGYFYAKEYAIKYNNLWCRYSAICIEIENYFSANPKARLYNAPLVELLMELVKTNENLLALLAGNLVVAVHKNHFLNDTVESDTQNMMDMNELLQDLLSQQKTKECPSI